MAQSPFPFSLYITSPEICSPASVTRLAPEPRHGVDSYSALRGLLRVIHSVSEDLQWLTAQQTQQEP